MDRLLRLGGIAGAALTCALASSRPASAAEQHGAKWVVDTAGGACAPFREELEHEIELACAAVGSSCKVVGAAGDAELRATLSCHRDDDVWTLETRTIEGARLARIDLEGGTADRLRQAAMEVARDAAPERTLAVEALRNTLVESDRVATAEPDAGKLAVAVALRGGVNGAGTSTGGGRAMLGYRVATHVSATFGVGGELGGSGVDARRHGRAGVGLALGAPFTITRTGALGVVGFGAEIGADVGQSYPLSAAYGTATAVPAQTKGGVFSQYSVYVQSSARGFRAFGALSLLVVSNEREIVAGALDAGVAFAGL